MNLQKWFMGALFWGSCLLIGCTNAPNREDSFLLSLLTPISENNLEHHNNDSSTVFVNVRLFDKITEAPGSGSGSYADPNKAINGVFGCGKTCGSLDVYSLKFNSTAVYCKPNEKCIVLEIEGKKIQNGLGIDFVVFENPFCIGGESNYGISHFMEPVIVEVSYDGTNWCGWNPEYTGDLSNASLNNPNNWKRFAGIEPVVYNQNTWTLTEEEIFEKNHAGGDGFDLGDPNFGQSGDNCTTTVKTQILNDGFIYLRLTTSFSRGFPITPGTFDQASDIDGVIAKYVIDR